jgi:hypothetical protein
MDELALLWDEELAMMDPDALPRRLITDFSVYNAEVGVGGGAGRARCGCRALAAGRCCAQASILHPGRCWH